MSLSNESKYATRRTYVLKLRSDAKTDGLTGRLENIVTGRQYTFESGPALLDSLAREIDLISSELGFDAAGKDSPFVT